MALDFGGHDMKRYIKASDDIQYMPSKNELIRQIDEATRKYGRRKVSEELRSAFNRTGSFYQEDKRVSGIKYALDVIDNCYLDEMPVDPDEIDNKNTKYYYSWDTNKEIKRMVADAIRWLSTE